MDSEPYVFDVPNSNNLLSSVPNDKKDLDNESDFGQFINDEDDEAANDYYSHYENGYRSNDFLSRQTQRRNKNMSYADDEYSDDEDFNYNAKHTDFDGENYTINDTSYYNTQKTPGVSNAVDKLIKNIKRFFPPSEKKSRKLGTLSPKNSQMRSYCFSDTKMGKTYENIMNERMGLEKVSEDDFEKERRPKSVVMASDVKDENDDEPPKLEKRKKSIAPNGGFFLKHPLEGAVYNNDMEAGDDVDEHHSMFEKRKKSVAPNSGYFLRNPVDMDEEVEDESSEKVPDILISVESNRDTYLAPDNVVSKKSILRNRDSNHTSPKTIDRGSAYHSIFINPQSSEIPQPDYDEDENYEIDFGEEIKADFDDVKEITTFNEGFSQDYESTKDHDNNLNNTKNSLQLKKGLQRTNIELDVPDEAPKPPPFREDNMKVFRSSNVQPEPKNNNMNFFSNAFKKVSSYITMKKEKNFVSE